MCSSGGAGDRAASPARAQHSAVELTIGWHWDLNLALRTLNREVGLLCAPHPARSWPLKEMRKKWSRMREGAIVGCIYSGFFPPVSAQRVKWGRELHAPPLPGPGSSWQVACNARACPRGWWSAQVRDAGFGLFLPVLLPWCHKASVHADLVRDCRPSRVPGWLELLLAGWQKPEFISVPCPRAGVTSWLVEIRFAFLRKGLGSVIDKEVLHKHPIRHVLIC